MKKQKIVMEILLIVVLAGLLFPLYWLFSLSFRSEEELKTGLSFIPHSLTLKNWLNLIQSGEFTTPLLNSFKVAFISLFLSLTSGSCAAYILGRSRFKHWIHRPFIGWILIVRILPPITLGIPLYMLFNKLNLLQSSVPIILSHSLMNLPFILWFMISAFKMIPAEIEESAKIDGAGDGRIYFSLALPLAAPSIAAVSIFSFMNSWNEYAYAVVMTQNPGDFTLPLKLATFNSEQELIRWGSLASGGSLSLLPLMIFALIMQRFLVSGLTAGSVKS